MVPSKARHGRPAGNLMARQTPGPATTPVVAGPVLFLIHSRRDVAALTALLGQKIVGFLISDRWHADKVVPVLRRRVCWAHLKRDFQKCLDRGGPGQAIGAADLAIVRRVFKAWNTRDCRPTPFLTGMV
jgi:transposase